MPRKKESTSSNLSPSESQGASAEKLYLNDQEKAELRNKPREERIRMLEDLHKKLGDILNVADAISEKSVDYNGETLTFLIDTAIERLKQKQELGD